MNEHNFEPGDSLAGNTTPVVIAFIPGACEDLLLVKGEQSSFGDWSLPWCLVASAELPEEALGRLVKNTTGKEPANAEFLCFHKQAGESRMYIIYQVKLPGMVVRPPEDAAFFRQEELPPDIPSIMHRELIKGYFSRLKFLRDKYR